MITPKGKCYDVLSPRSVPNFRAKQAAASSLAYANRVAHECTSAKAACTAKRTLDLDNGILSMC